METLWVDADHHGSLALLAILNRERSVENIPLIMYGNEKDTQ